MGHQVGRAARAGPAAAGNPAPAGPGGEPSESCRVPRQSAPAFPKGPAVAALPLVAPGRPRGLVRHRALVGALVRKELATRFGKGPRALAFALASPTALVAVHAVLGIGVLGAAWRVPGAAGGSGALAALAAGVLVFAVFADVALSAPGLISRSPGLVKRVAFPLEALVAARVLGALAGALPGAGLLLAGVLLAGAPVRGVVWLVPALAPAILATAAAAYLGAALGPFFRDAGRATGLAVHALHLLSPVVYPLGALPEAWRPLALLNPLAVSIEQVRAVLLLGAAPDAPVLAGSAAAAGLALVLARGLYLRVEKGFADVV